MLGVGGLGPEEAGWGEGAAEERRRCLRGGEAGPREEGGLGRRAGGAALDRPGEGLGWETGESRTMMLGEETGLTASMGVDTAKPFLLFALPFSGDISWGIEAFLTLMAGSKRPGQAGTGTALLYPNRRGR